MYTLMEKVVELLNKVYEKNKARKEYAQALVGKRGDPLLDARKGKKFDFNAYRADCGDTPVDVDAVNEMIRELNLERAGIVRELRATWKDLMKYENLFLDGVLNSVFNHAVVEWGLTPDFILEDVDSVVKLQKAKNGKGAGVIAVNVRASK